MWGGRKITVRLMRESDMTDFSPLSVVALICARGGSKGLPGKNVKMLHGKPLIAWAIGHARAVARVRRVIVSTDCPEIAGVARDAGAEVPFMRPAELAQDSSPEWHVWRHALEFLQQDEGALPDALLVTPATAPLRRVVDIDRCLDEYARGDADIVLTVTDAHRNPWFSMVKELDDGYVALVNSPKGSLARRQDAPVVYDITPVAYVARPQFVLAADHMFAGRVRHVMVPVSTSVDIDTREDFRIAECLMASHTDDNSN